MVSTQDNGDKLATEFTKREKFAMSAMQGILARTHVYSADELAKVSVIRAEALLKALEANNG